MERIQYLVYSKVATPEHSTLETLTCATHSTPEAVILAVAECASNETILAIYRMKYEHDADHYSMDRMTIKYERGRLQLC